MSARSLEHLSGPEEVIQYFNDLIAEVYRKYIEEKNGEVTRERVIEVLDDFYNKKVEYLLNDDDFDSETIRKIIELESKTTETDLEQAGDLEETLGEAEEELAPEENLDPQNLEEALQILLDSDNQTIEARWSGFRRMLLEAFLELNRQAEAVDFSVEGGSDAALAVISGIRKLDELVTNAQLKMGAANFELFATQIEWLEGGLVKNNLNNLSKLERVLTEKLEEFSPEVQWPPPQATELVTRAQEIINELIPLREKLETDQYDPTNPNDVQSTDTKLAELAEELKNLSAKLIEEIEIHRRLESTATSSDGVRQHRQNVSNLESNYLNGSVVSNLKRELSEIGQLLWEKRLLIDYPSVKEVADELNLSPIVPSGNPRLSFGTLVESFKDLKLKINNLSTVLSEQSDQAKISYLQNTYMHPANLELDRRESQAFDHWKAKFDQIYPEADPTNPNSLAFAVNRVTSGSVQDYRARSEHKRCQKLIESTREAVVEHLNEAELSETDSVKYEQHLESYLHRVLKQIEGLEEQAEDFEKKLGLGAVFAATEFFSGGLGGHEIHEFEDGLWVQYPPEKLAMGLWHELLHIMDVAANGDKLWIGMHPLDHEMGFGESITFAQVIESFGNLGLLFPNDPAKGERFKEIAGNMLVHIARIHNTYYWGNSVHEREKGPGVIEFYTNLPNQKDTNFTGQDLARIARIGETYMHEEGRPTWGDRFHATWQAYMFLHEPTPVNIAVLSSSPDEKPVFAKSVRIKNELTTFPNIASQDAENRSTYDNIIKRKILIKIANMVEVGEQLPWVRDPEWGVRRPGETLSDVANRNHEIGKKHIKLMLYGTENPTKKDGVLRGVPGSFYERMLSQLRAVRSGKDISTLPANERLTPADEKLIKDLDGFFVEQMTQHLMYFFLVPTKAEGLKLTGNNRTIDGRTYKEIDGRSGPTAEFFIGRWLSHAQMYRNKLRGEGSSDGSFGPPISINEFYIFMQTLLDYATLIPEGEEVGTTLRDAVLLASTGDDFKRIPWESYVVAKDGKLMWSEQLTLGALNAQRVYTPNNTIGISWHNVVRHEAGSDGSVVAFNPEVAEKIQKISRDAYYVCERDFGYRAYTWDSEGQYNAFRIYEREYLRQKAAGGPIVKPADVTQDTWDLVIKLNKVPTPRHQIVDGVEVGNPDSGKVVRYLSLMYDILKIPENPRDMNDFEKEVLLTGTNDRVLAFKKLYVGKIIIGSMSVTDTSAMDFDDVDAVAQMLCKEHWKSRRPPLLQKVKSLLRGSPEVEEYQGVGYFTYEETKALLRVAGVPTGLLPRMQAVINKVQKFGL